MELAQIDRRCHRSVQNEQDHGVAASWVNGAGLNLLNWEDNFCDKMDGASILMQKITSLRGRVCDLAIESLLSIFNIFYSLHFRAFRGEKCGGFVNFRAFRGEKRGGFGFSLELAFSKIGIWR